MSDNNIFGMKRLSNQANFIQSHSILRLRKVDNTPTKPIPKESINAHSHFINKYKNRKPMEMVKIVLAGFDLYFFTIKI